MVADSRGDFVSTLSGRLDGGSLLARIWSKDPDLAQTLQTIIDGVNTTAKNAGVAVSGDIPAPKAPDSVNVKVSGEMMHISVNHSGPVERGVRYFSEISPDNPSFGQPIVVDHGTSRTSHPIPLPTFPDGGGATKVAYHVRSYVQNPGGPPSRPTNAGSFTMSGTTNMTMLPSTGSGTAPNTGQSAGQGLGKFQTRQG